jgi:NAD(P)H-dependent flavin oxidoreductase YrpB (nitropropane dioxygenase family)
MTLPKIIQGGMGIGVSAWTLARAVSSAGQLGVVSGTALDTVIARRLQLGDPGGHVRRALQHFPFPKIAQRVHDHYFLPGGKPTGAAFRTVPMHTIASPQSLLELTVVANFAEVFLAKEGHDGLVGINMLEKIQLPTPPSLFGAMLAGVDFVLMGAGIPRTIPGILDNFSAGRPARLRLDVMNSRPGEEFDCIFDPSAFCGGPPPLLKRPRFLAVIASATLALTLARKSTGKVDGFIVEGATAGGHNAPPRGAVQLSEAGEPIYGARDVPDLEKIRALGLPYWLAGSYSTPQRLAEALRLGATGIQVGTAFAFCEESGVEANLKRRLLDQSRAGRIRVFTDPVASPTGFPFKTAQISGTLSDASVYANRERVCDMGYLRQIYRQSDGSLGYRCPGEPIESYLRKGGDLNDATGRKCLCNGLAATIGLGQVRRREEEPALVTAGADVTRIADFLPPGQDTYRAADVITRLLAPFEA